MSGDNLNIIGLISGGKDSFFSLLHCIRHGHRVVALANLFPADNGSSDFAIRVIDADTLPAESQDGISERDLNSFMYQTVGHEVIPLYARATGLPLYRRPIRGGAIRHERDYDASSAGDGASPAAADIEDETESMIPLLRAIMDKHPEANAVSSGAILSTYQRTRVESVALRLGLTPLSYLWKYPILPPPAGSAPDEAQLLHDMAAAGLDARIIKVASAGLDESHLWERVSSEGGVARIKASLRMFGAAEGASLGEGGEFETLVVDGPYPFFKMRIDVPENGRQKIPEGGGSTWLMLRSARLAAKSIGDAPTTVRQPDLLDDRFQSVVDSLPSGSALAADPNYFDSSKLLSGISLRVNDNNDAICWSFMAEESDHELSIEEETKKVVIQIEKRLAETGQRAASITSIVICLRAMDDFPKVNAEYGKLFIKANPPSRITISCGSLLPQGCKIVIHATLPCPSRQVRRNGLHVQARSYWAPANIGPYSQAIETDVTGGGEPTGLRTVHVAGQIPLIPATMTLPQGSQGSQASLQLQTVLSLQHLWRIAADMKVQTWTSAIVYFARTETQEKMKRGARLAGRAWALAHGSPEDEEQADSGLDPWDLKYNAEFQTLAASADSRSMWPVPDWSIFTLRQQNEPDACVPPMFAAEIESLPRKSLVEWHAHVGLRQVENSSVEFVFHGSLGQGRRAWHLIAKTANAKAVVYSTVASYKETQDVKTASESQKAIIEGYMQSLKLLQPHVDISTLYTPYLTYADANAVSGLWEADLDSQSAVVPCHSLWSAAGEPVASVALFKSLLESA